MLPLSILLIVYSPYTAIVPIFFIGFKVMQNRDVIYKNPWNTGLLLLFIWSFLVGIANDNPFSSAASVAILLYFFVSVYIQNYYNDEKSIDKLLNSIIVFSLGPAFIGIVEKLTAIYYDSIWWGYLFGIPSKIIARESYRIYSTFGNPNVAGTWFAAVILMCIYFYSSSQINKKIFYGALTLLFVVVLALTGSRGAALGLEMGLATFIFLKKRKDSTVFMSFVFLCVIILMFILPELNPSGDLLSSSMNHEVNSSVSNRQALWSGSLNMFKEKPVTGWGLLGIYFANNSMLHYHSRQPHSHNIWITIIATLGIVGLCIYLYMKHYLLERIIMLYNDGCNLTPFLASVQVLILGHGLVDFTIMSPQGGLLFFGCSAVISSLAMQRSNLDSRDGYRYHYIFKELIR